MTRSTAQLPYLLSINEVAEHLGVNVRRVRQLVAERRIPYIKWGHLLRFDPEEVADWLAAAHIETVNVATMSRSRRLRANSHRQV